MPTDPVAATLAGTMATAVATVAVWVLTGRRRDREDGAGVISDAAQAITESAMRLVAQHQAEAHDCREALAALRLELAEARAEHETLRVEVAALRG